MRHVLVFAVVVAATLLMLPASVQARYTDGMNLYQYVGSNPLINLDPNGTTIVGSPGMGASNKSIRPIVKAIGNKIAHMVQVKMFEKQGVAVVRLEAPPGTKWFISTYKSLIKKLYKDFRNRRNNEYPCGLEQFVLVGHSHSATAIYELIKEGHFTSGRTIVEQPAALIMVDAVLGGRNKDLTDPIKKMGKTLVMNYYQTDENVLLFGTGTPVKGIIMPTKRKGAKGWDLNKGGIRIHNTTHTKILQNPQFLSDIVSRVSVAYMQGILLDQAIAKRKRPEQWDTKPGEGAW